MPTYDLTTFTEEDLLSNLNVLSSTNLEVDGYGGQDANLFKQIGGIGTDDQLRFQFTTDSVDTSQSVWAYVGLQTSGSGSLDDYVIVVFKIDNGSFVAAFATNLNNTFDTVASDIDQDSPVYITVDLDYGSGDATCEVFSDSSRSTSLGSLTKAFDTFATWDYIYAWDGTTIGTDNTLSGNVIDLETREGTTVPAAPSNLRSGGTTGTDTIPIQWDQVSDATGYEVYRAQSTGSQKSDYTNIATISSGGTTTYDDTNLESGERYFYRVTATNSAGESSLSNEFDDTTVLDPSQNVAASEPSPGSVDVTWSRPTSDDSPDGGVEVQRSTDGFSTVTSLATLAPSATSYTDSNPPSGQTVEYRTRRFTDHASVLSGSASVTTTTTVSVPTTTASAATPAPTIAPGSVSVGVPTTATGATTPAPSVEGASSAVISVPETGLGAATPTPSVSTSTIVAVPPTQLGAETPEPAVGGDEWAIDGEILRFSDLTDESRTTRTLSLSLRAGVDDRDGLLAPLRDTAGDVETVLSSDGSFTTVDRSVTGGVVRLVPPVDRRPPRETREYLVADYSETTADQIGTTFDIGLKFIARSNREPVAEPLTETRASDEWLFEFRAGSVATTRVEYAREAGVDTAAAVERLSLILDPEQVATAERALSRVAATSTREVPDGRNRTDDDSASPSGSNTVTVTTPDGEDPLDEGDGDYVVREWVTGWLSDRAYRLRLTLGAP